MVTGDAELAASEPPGVVLVELDSGATAALVLVLVLVLVPMLVLDAAGVEVLVVVVPSVLLGVGVVVAPCEPPAAITAQASANVERLAAAT